MKGRRAAEFKQEVRAAFGADMQHATPATVREFVDRYRQGEWRSQKARRVAETGDPDPPVIIPDSRVPNTYEGVVRDFFRESLDAEDDRALISLWLFALELAYAGIEDVDSDRIGKLFE